MTAGAVEPGRDKPKCGAARRGANADSPCTRPAGWGTQHAGVGNCKLHGGNTATHVQAAQKVLAERAVQTYGIRRSLPPALALLEEFEWSLGHVAWLREIVQQLEPDALVWGKTEEHEKVASEFPGVDVKYMASPSVWLKLYHDERRMMLDLGKTIETLKLEQRKTELLDRHVAQMAMVLVAALRRGGVDASEEQAKVWLDEEIRALTGGVKQIEGVAA